VQIILKEVKMVSEDLPKVPLGGEEVPVGGAEVPFGGSDPLNADANIWETVK